MIPKQKQFARKSLTSFIQGLHFFKHIRFHYALSILMVAVLSIAGCKKDDATEPNPEPVSKVTAHAGQDQTMKAGQTITLDGSNSRDSQGKPLSFKWLVTKSPAGGTISFAFPSPAEAEITADVAGEYIVELTVTSTNGQAKDQVKVTVLAPDQLILSGEINTDRVLENIQQDPTKADYRVTGDVLLKARLIIKPGVVIEFEQDKGLSVFPQGSLVAIGTAAQKIIFTGSSQTKGFWKGILVESNSAQNEMTHVLVEYGGSSHFPDMFSDTKANVVLAGFNPSAPALKITHSGFTQSGGYGVFVQGMAELNGFTANFFESNSASAIYVPARQLHKLDAISHFVGNNGFNGVETGGTLSEQAEVTWPDFMDGSAYYVSNDISIQSGLRIAEGATLEFHEGIMIQVLDGGYLQASGTNANKIVFTARVQMPDRHWGGIIFKTDHDQNKLHYSEISYAGAIVLPGSNNMKANVVIGNTGKASIQQSVIKNGQGWGVVAFKETGSKINDDVATVNQFDALTLGHVRLTPTPSPAVQLAGEWLDELSFRQGYTVDEKFYDINTGKWFRGAANPWTMNPLPGFGIKIDQNGNYIWTIAERFFVVNCDSYTADFIKGTVASNGYQLTFHESYWKSMAYNSCDISQNIDQNITPGMMTLRYEITQLQDTVTGEPYWEMKLYNPDDSFFKFYKR